MEQHEPCLIEGEFRGLGPRVAQRAQERQEGVPLIDGEGDGRVAVIKDL
jgi:hypothetical protein